MKPITIRNKEYYCKVVKHGFGDYTNFYKSNPPDLCDYFEVSFNIESAYYTKEYVKEKVEEAQIEYLRIQDRKLEIERGEII
jgi:hypothetical protein